jgi:hypothetical protein
VREGAIVRDCREIESMGVTCNVNIIDYSVSVEFGRGRDSVDKWRWRNGR